MNKVDCWCKGEGGAWNCFDNWVTCPKHGTQKHNTQKDNHIMTLSQARLMADNARAAFKRSKKDDDYDKWESAEADYAAIAYRDIVNRRISMADALGSGSNMMRKVGE